MKKNIYIFLFIILGILLLLLVHSGIEIWYIWLLESNFDVYGLGFSWESWFLIHKIWAVTLFILGAFLGWRGGIYWWGRIYERS